MHSHCLPETPTAATPVATKSMHLHTEVHRALARCPYFAGRNLRVELRESDVVLSGVLGSYYQKQMAQESVLAIDGIRSVHNEIKVVSA